MFYYQGFSSLQINNGQFCFDCEERKGWKRKRYSSERKSKQIKTVREREREREREKERERGWGGGCLSSGSMEISK